MRTVLFILIFLLLHGVGFSQKRDDRYFDFGVFVGGAYYIGDINPNKHFNQFTKPAGGVLVRYNFNRRAALRAGFTMGSIEAHDSYASSGWQKQRNLSFRSPVRELATLFEFNFLDYKMGGKESETLSPFIFIGIAGFNFAPQGQIDGNWSDLQPLGTEGQGFAGGASANKYKLMQVSIPFGIGIKTNFSKGICLGVEWGMRKTFTDYLDDVGTRYYNPILLAEERGRRAALLADPSSQRQTNTGKQRGTPSGNDWYSFFGLALTIKIEKQTSCTNSLKMGGT